MEILFNDKMEVPWCSSTCRWCTDSLINIHSLKGVGPKIRWFPSSSRNPSRLPSTRCRGLWSRVGISLHRGRVQWCRGVLLGELGIWVFLRQISGQNNEVRVKLGRCVLPQNDHQCLPGSERLAAMASEKYLPENIPLRNPAFFYLE